MTAAILSAALVPLSYLAGAAVMELLTRRRLHRPGRLALFLAALYVTSLAEALGLIPTWLMWALQAALLVAYWLSLHDRGGPRRRRRAVPALKRVREYLARGVPARRATA